MGGIREGRHGQAQHPGVLSCCSCHLSAGVLGLSWEPVCRREVQVWGAGALARTGFLNPVTGSCFFITVQGSVWSPHQPRSLPGTARAVARGPCSHTPEGLTHRAENRSTAWLQTRAGAGRAFFGEGWGEAVGFHTHPSCGPRQAGASLGTFPRTGRAQGGRAVREHE